MWLVHHLLHTFSIRTYVWLNQCHSLKFSIWMDHQYVMGHISKSFVIAHLVLSEKNSRNPLHPWGFHKIVLFLTFSDNAPNLFGELDDNSHVTWLECSVRSSWRSLLLSTIWCVYLTALSGRNSCGIIIVLWFFSKSWYGFLVGTSSPLWSISQEVSSLPYVFVIPWWRSSWGDLFPYLFQDFFLYTYFLFYCLSRR